VTHRPGRSSRAYSTKFVRGEQGSTLLKEKTVRFHIDQGWHGRFVTHFVVTLVAQLIILGLGALTGVAAARLLGPQGRGELAALTLWPLLLVFLSGMGINSSIVFFTGKQRYGLSELWTASVVIGLALSLFAVFTGLWIIP